MSATGRGALGVAIGAGAVAAALVATTGAPIGGAGLAVGCAIGVERARAWRPSSVVPVWAAHPWLGAVLVLLASYLLAVASVPAAVARAALVLLAAAAAIAAWHATGPSPGRLVLGGFLLEVSVAQVLVAAAAWWPTPATVGLAAVAVALRVSSVAALALVLAWVGRALFRQARRVLAAVSSLVRGSGRAAGAG